MFGFDPKDAAHLQSNYNEWKANVLRTLQVDVDLSKIGVSSEKIDLLVNGISYAMKNNKIFALFIEAKGKLQSLVTFIPNTNQSNQSGVITTYSSRLHFINAIKLVCITHHNIYIHEEDNTQLQG